MSKSNSKKAAKKNAGNKPGTYRQLMSVTNKPLAERQELAIGRDGAERTPRRFHLIGTKLRTLREAWETAGKRKNSPPNPHNEGTYRHFVAALITLGVDVAHKFSDVKTEMKRTMSLADTRKGEGAKATTAWERFVGKDMRNTDTGKSENDRIKQNAEVLQRLTGLTPYGFKLLQIGKEILQSSGMVVDILKRGEEIHYRLNTDSATPLNEWRRVREEKPGLLGLRSFHRKTTARKPKAKQSEPAPVQSESTEKVETTATAS